MHRGQGHLYLTIPHDVAQSIHDSLSLVRGHSRILERFCSFFWMVYATQACTHTHTAKHARPHTHQGSLRRWLDPRSLASLLIHKGCSCSTCHCFGSRIYRTSYQVALTTVTTVSRRASVDLASVDLKKRVAALVIKGWRKRG